MPAIINMLNATTAKIGALAPTEQEVLKCLVFVALGCVFELFFEFVVWLARFAIKTSKKLKERKAKNK